MDLRRIVDEIIPLPVPIHADTYKVDWTWADLKKTHGLKDDDVIVDIRWKKQKESGFMSMKMEDELRELYFLYIDVKRKRPETDEEYSKRQSEQVKRQKEIDEREKLEYLRLKAKFEGQV